MEELLKTKARVESILKELQAHAVQMPNSMVWELHGLMLETATALMRASNSQRPLLRLPNEILGQIMAYIPDLREDKEENLRPVWRSSATDTLMLFPISQTCHRLRAVALGHPLLWRHIHSTYFVAELKGCIEELVSRSGDLPLTVVMNADPSLIILSKACLRAQELHMVHMDRTVHLLHIFFQILWPELQVLSLTHSEETMWNGDDLIPLSHAPRLRYLHLQHLSTFISGPVPSLTHISLSMLHLRDCHARVAEFLSSCPNLVNATLDGMNHHTTPRRPPTLVLPRLKRITFHNMTTPIIQFYLAVFSCPRPGLALQILSPGDVPLRQFPLADLLPQYARGAASSLAISGHLQDDEEDTEDDDKPELLLSVTAYSETNAFRICRPYEVLMQHLHRIVADKKSLSNLREVWIVNVPVSYSERLTDIVSSVLASLPALETLTVVLDHSQFPRARPNLRILPRLSDLSSERTRLRTVRLVHGFSKHRRSEDQSGSSSGRAFVKLPLSKMLAQLLSREYDYLDVLILQTMPHFHVDESELEEVAEHIPTVRHETIDALPSIRYPDFCYEPASGSKAAFPASLW
ncbi:hypothetical protein K466DRAFT_78121 [Polyporus arcularius HHB13444]|uniref:F-box domain-containing protein n=1 Tax=Polyporus arcularius HHB13444 TaxID=1314778 RepID=A0A5C3PGA3_9APHY|nr:hypothetical protein K466DRAFT_78121 [Polyporus arcularius HHB13444]